MENATLLKNAPGGAEFVPELIHNRPGTGSEITAIDLNDDGAVDLITATNRGTFIFWNTPRYKKPLTALQKVDAGTNSKPASKK